MANRANGRCPGCGLRRGNYKQSGSCAACHKAANPTVDGVELRTRREALGLTVMEAAAALGMTPKQWIDNVEDADHVPTKAAELIAALETATERRHPAPPGALAVEAVGI